MKIYAKLGVTMLVAFNLGQYLKSFGQDQRGEIYVMTSAQLGLDGTSGKVYKMSSDSHAVK
jgi:hypothetical protein